MPYAQLPIVKMVTYPHVMEIVLHCAQVVVKHLVNKNALDHVEKNVIVVQQLAKMIVTQLVI